MKAKAGFMVDITHSLFCTRSGCIMLLYTLYIQKLFFSLLCDTEVFNPYIHIPSATHSLSHLITFASHGQDPLASSFNM